MGEEKERIYVHIREEKISPRQTDNKVEIGKISSILSDLKQIVIFGYGSYSYLRI